MKTIRKMHDWSIFMIAWTSLFAVNTSKVLISTSNLTTDDFPKKFNSEFYNPQKQVRAYILE